MNLKFEKMEDRKLNEKESLELIATMISRTKERYVGDGNILLMWGYLVVAVSAAVWMMLALTRDYEWNWLWFLIPVIGCPTTVVMAKKQKRDSGVTTYSDKITSMLWTVAGVSEIVLILFCLGFLFIGSVDCWSAMLIYTLIVMSFAEIVQWMVVKERSFAVGGFIGLIAGMVTLCCVVGGIPLDARWFMPMFIISFAAMMIIPGHILNYKSKHDERA